MTLLTVLVSLTSHYATYVITRSEFPPVLWLRDRAFARHGGDWVAYLITCSFCTAFYVAGVVTLLVDLLVALPLPILVWLAAASVAGVLVEVVDALRALASRSS